MACASSSTARWKRLHGEALLVADDDGIGRDDDVGARDLGPARVPLGPVEDDDAQTGREARDLRAPSCRRASWGATTSTGASRRPSACSMHTCAMVWSVLPRPISSARTPPLSRLAKSLEERDALGLVRAERRLQPLGDLGGTQRRRAGPRAARLRRRGRSTRWASPRAGKRLSSSTSAVARISGNARPPRRVALVKLRHDAQERAQALDGDVHVVRLADAQCPRGRHDVASASSPPSASRRSMRSSSTGSRSMRAPSTSTPSSRPNQSRGSSLGSTRAYQRGSRSTTRNG